MERGGRKLPDFEIGIWGAQNIVSPSLNKVREEVGGKIIIFLNPMANIQKKGSKFFQVPRPMYRYKEYGRDLANQQIPGEWVLQSIQASREGALIN